MDRPKLISLSAQAVITDIEGTTTPLAFVKEVLFPYAYQHLANFLAQHHKDSAAAEQIRKVCQHADAEMTPAEVSDLLQSWIEMDLKIAALKSLQTMVWRGGYESGEIKSLVYPDAVNNLKKWWRIGLPLYVYSSGSVEAQKLLFKYTEHGDLSYLFSGHFDLTAGGKENAESYIKIADTIRLSPQDILFLSDLKNELDAAQEAGMQTLWVVRDGPLPTQTGHRPVRTFDAI